MSGMRKEYWRGVVWREAENGGNWRRRKMRVGDAERRREVGESGAERVRAKADMGIEEKGGRGGEGGDRRANMANGIRNWQYFNPAQLGK